MHYRGYIPVLPFSIGPITDLQCKYKVRIQPNFETIDRNNDVNEKDRYMKFEISTISDLKEHITAVLYTIFFFLYLQ